MKKMLATIASIVTLSICAAPTEVSSDKALELTQALLQSGVPFMETESGFSTVNPVTISCKVSREHMVSGGVLLQSPKCFMHAKRDAIYHFSFDQELENPVALWDALQEAGAQTDGAMGTFYTVVKDISCTMDFSPRKNTCTFDSEL